MPLYPPRRIPDYTRRLSRPLTLADGTRLVTLKDAGDLIAVKFATVTTWRTLEIAIELLMRAAMSGKHADIEAATEQLLVVLHAHRLM